VSNTTPTHEITHQRFGTRAAVRLANSIQDALADETSPSARRGAQDHVAIAFKKTTPLDGPDLSHMRHINYSELTIVPLDPLDSEPSVRMGPGGVVLDEEAEGCGGEDCCARCGTGYHCARCPLS